MMSTSAVFEYERDAIRVKARFYEKNTDQNDSAEINSSEVRKFSVDPNLTSYETLRNLLSRAFDYTDDDDTGIRISYHCANEWLPMLSDWDLDAAVLSASDPCLQLALVASNQRDKVNLVVENEAKMPITAASPTVAAQDALQQLVITSKRDGANFLKSTLPALSIKLQKLVNLPQEEVHRPPSPKILRPPLSDREFRSFLDNVGELIRPRELRLVIYKGGVEPQLRKVVWKHLLGVYPNGLDGRKRLDYMRQKSLEYQNLKSAWLDIIANGKVTDDIKMVTNMVRKDVLRTDRQHKFYAGEANENVTSLYNILTTFALHHPSVGYCQGMSDLLSPIMMTMMDEAHAYVCFCAVMIRQKKNFMVDGVAMTKMFQHLSEGLTYYDPELFAYLKINQADDLLFCYRWLLLEMKREFAFEESLQVLETLWSSLPPTYAEKDGLKLFEVKILTPELTKKTSSSELDKQIGTPRKETVYAKMVSLRRRTTSGDLKKIMNPLRLTKEADRPRIHSDSSAPTRTTNSESRGPVVKTSSLGNNQPAPQKIITNLSDFSKLASPTSPTSPTAASSTSSIVSEKQKSVELDDPFDSDIGYVNGSSSTTTTSAMGNNNSVSVICDRLPDPTEFGDGNPFLIFICISCLLQHRNQIMSQRFDYQEIAMYFDKMVRKHNVDKTLALARKLFAEYLNDDWSQEQQQVKITTNEEINLKPSC